MENILSSNLKRITGTISSEHIRMLERLAKADAENLEHFISRDGKQNILFKKGDKKIYLHSKYNVDNEVNEWIKQFNGKEYDALFVFGFGMAHHVKALNANYPDTRMLVVEPSQEVFAHALNCVELTGILGNKNIDIIVGDDFLNRINDLFSIWLSEKCYPKIQFLHLPSYGSIYPDEINEAMKIVHSFIIKMHTVIRTQRRMKSMWIKNAFSNYRYAINSVSAGDFIGKLKNKPLVIVSAGPSLDKNIDILKEYKDQVYILAVGTAIGILAKHGIKAELAGFIDGHPIEGKVFDAGKDNAELILFTSNFYYELLEKNTDKKIIHVPLNGNEYDKWLCRLKGFNEDKVFNTGPSVANIMFDVAVKWGFDPIMFVGQDMAYQNNKLYADGDPVARKGVDENSSKRLIKMKDIYGNEILTAQNLYTMKKSFDDYCRNKSDLPAVINCTQGGLGIEGIPNRDLKDVLSEVCRGKLIKTDYVTSLYDRIENENKNKLNISDVFCRILENVAIACELTDKRIKLMHDYLQYHEKNEYDKTRFDEMLDRDTLIRNELGEKTESIKEFINSSTDLITVVAKQNRSISREKDKGDAEAVAAEVNGTMNQLAERLQTLWTIKAVLKELVDCNSDGELEEIRI